MQLHQYTLVYMLQLRYQPNMKRITNEREAGRLIGRVKTLYQAKDNSMERSKTLRLW